MATNGSGVVFVWSIFRFSLLRKEHLWVGYGSKLGKGPNDQWLREEKVEENLELAYAISVHKSQGSEFDRVYFIVPKHKAVLMSPELFYTGITRAKRHCTLLIEEDITPLLDMKCRRSRTCCGSIHRCLSSRRCPTH